MGMQAKLVVEQVGRGGRDVRVTDQISGKIVVEFGFMSDHDVRWTVRMVERVIAYMEKTSPSPVKRDEWE